MRKLIIVTSDVLPAEGFYPFLDWRDWLHEQIKPRDVVLVASDALAELIDAPTGASRVYFASDGTAHYPDGRKTRWASDSGSIEVALARAISLWSDQGGLAFHVDWQSQNPHVVAVRPHDIPYKSYSGGLDDHGRTWPWTFADDDLVVLDTETSGKVPARHQLLEVAAIRTNAKGQVLDVYDARVDFDPTLPYESEALTHNRYLQRVARGDWKDARSLEEAIARLLPILKHAPALVAHYASFDRAVIEAACDRLSLETPVFRTTFDTCVMARRLLQKTGRTQNAKLDTVCDYYGISNAGNHAALVDAKRCLAVYRRLAAGDVERGPVLHAL
jgi:DNA polymerase III epsilon subunit-like protein